MAKNTDIVKKPKGGALASWDQELAQFATDIAAKEVAPAGQFISFRGGILSIAGSPQQDNEVKVVVLDHCFENALYEGDFNPDVPQNPICFAFGREEGEL